MKFFKKIILIILLLFTYISLCAFSYVNAISKNIESSVFRLHVIANSDYQEDQDLKYLVRDKILEYINSCISDNTSKEEVILFAKENVNKIKEIAENTILENGYDYPVQVEIGNFEFPTKTYGDIKFPPGYYDALRIKIGEAKGKNWWCVMFPPLCFVDVTSGIVPEDSKETLKENLSSEEYNLISDDSEDVNFKFKIVEMFQNFNLKIAKK